MRIHGRGLLLSSSFLAGASLVAGACVAGRFSPTLQTEADGTIYSMVLDQGSGFEEGGSFLTVKTVDGNDISIHYEGFANDGGSWSLTSGGCIQNYSAVTGLKSVSVSFGDDAGSLSIAYGWSAGCSEAGTTIDPSSPSFDFGGYGPDFFKIKNAASDPVCLKSITLTYACEEKENFLFEEKEDGTYELSKYLGKNESVVIPSQHQGKDITSIGNRVFGWNGFLKSVSIPNTVKSIGDYAFCGDGALVTAAIPNSVVSIGACAFISCPLTSIVIPDSVTTIGDNAFQNCSSAISISVGASLSSIGDYAFVGIPKVESIAVSSENPFFQSSDSNAIIRTSDRSLIAGCKNTVVPDWVESIVKNAFEDCASLASISIPSSVASIGDRAFSGCTSLSSITVPSSVASIGLSAFYGCSSLTIYCEAESQPSGWDSDWNPSGCPVVWGYTPEA